jgi:hypothetical protein
MMKFATWIGLVVVLSSTAGCGPTLVPGDFCDLASPLRWTDPATFDYLDEREPGLLDQMLAQNKLGATPKSEGGCAWGR